MPLITFSVNIIIDNITIEATEINFSSIKHILETYSSFLKDEELKYGNIGTFKYIEWKENLLAFSKEVIVLNNEVKSNVTFEDIFDFLEIKYFKQDDNYYLPTMIINNLKDFGNYLQIDFLGKNSISPLIENNKLYIITTNYVVFDRLYSPNEVILSKEVDNTKNIEVNELPNKIIIQLLKTYKIGNIKYFTFDEKVTQDSTNTFIVIFKNSNMNLIFVQNYSPDFNGNDWERFSISNDIAQKVANKLNLKIYYIPFIQLPLDSPGLVIFSPPETWNEIKKILEGEVK